MALYTVSIPDVDAGALSALYAVISAATKTLIQIAPHATAADLVITEVHISMDGSPATSLQAVQFFLMTQTTAGTGGAAQTPSPVRRLGTATVAQATALDASTAWSAEPTYGEVVKVLGAVSPVSGSLTVQYPLGREPATRAGGDRLALVYRSPTLGATPNLTAAIEFEE